MFNSFVIEMKNFIQISALFFLLFACYTTPELAGFDASQWKLALQDCATDRTDLGRLIVDRFDELKGSSQNEVRNLLGKQDGHELFNRNQKFFYYNLTCPDQQDEILQLRLRFDALGALREANIVKRKALLKS